MHSEGMISLSHSYVYSERESLKNLINLGNIVNLKLTNTDIIRYDSS